MTLDELRALARVRDGDSLRWPAPYDRSPTLEECELLYTLVRAVRPALVWESGTGYGISARFIVEALLANGHGKLVTFEPIRAFASEAERVLAGTPARIEAQPMPRVSHAPDLIHIDSGGPRNDEIGRWLKSKSLALIAVHDARREYGSFRFGHGTIFPTAGGYWIGRAGR